MILELSCFRNSQTVKTGTILDQEINSIELFPTAQGFTLGNPTTRTWFTYKRNHFQIAVSVHCPSLPFTFRKSGDNQIHSIQSLKVSLEALKNLPDQGSVDVFAYTSARKVESRVLVPQRSIHPLGHVNDTVLWKRLQFGRSTVGDGTFSLKISLTGKNANGADILLAHSTSDPLEIRAFSPQAYTKQGKRRATTKAIKKRKAAKKDEFKTRLSKVDKDNHTSGIRKRRRKTASVSPELTQRTMKAAMELNKLNISEPHGVPPLAIFPPQSIPNFATSPMDYDPKTPASATMLSSMEISDENIISPGQSDPMLISPLSISKLSPVEQRISSTASAPAPSAPAESYEWNFKEEQGYMADIEWEDI